MTYGMNLGTMYDHWKRLLHNNFNKSQLNLFLSLSFLYERNKRPLSRKGLIPRAPDGKADPAQHVAAVVAATC